MKYVMRYETAPDGLAKVPEHAEAHAARWAEFVAAGTLLAIGPFADPAAGAMAIFTTREAAETFAAGDPFVEHGIVARWEVLDWNEVLLP